MTRCLICNRSIEVSREAISAHADWHAEWALFIWFALWAGVVMSADQDPALLDWAVDENW